MSRIFTGLLSLMFALFAGPANSLTCPDLDGAYVYSDEAFPKYLGFFGSSVSQESIMNTSSPFGSTSGPNSVRNPVGLYGSSFNNTSANSATAINPPFIAIGGENIGRLTTNTNFFEPNFLTKVSLAEIDNLCGAFFSQPKPFKQPSPGVVIAADGTDPTILVVEWSPVTGATYYNVYVATTATFADAILFVNTPNTVAYLPGLQQGVTYYIAVTSVGIAGESTSYNYDSGYLQDTSAPARFTVTPSSSTGGVISPATAQIIDEGFSTSFTLTPDDGYEIDVVTGTCGGSLVGSVFTTAPITQDCTVEASFVASPITTYVITPSASAGGEITPNTPQIVDEGSTTSFTLLPNEGYEIDAVGGTCGGTLVDSTFTTLPASNNCTVAVSFAEIPPAMFTVTPSAGEGGSISPSVAQMVTEGLTTVFTLIPDSGYEVDTVSSTCGGSLSELTFTTDPIDGDCSVQANFKVVVTAQEAGTISLPIWLLYYLTNPEPAESN